MTEKICKKCKALNNQDAVSCVNWGTNVKYALSASEYQSKINELATSSFTLSLFPLGSLVIFALHLAVANMEITFDSTLAFLGLLLLMLFLGLSLYLGSYIISIPALILGIKGRKSEKKRFAIAGVIISIFNFSIPFLVSPVNELFLR